MLSTIREWLAHYRIEPLQRTHQHGHHELVWADEVNFDLWPNLDCSVPCSSLIGEYVVHKTAPLCQVPVELSAGLCEPLEDNVVIHLPWPNGPPCGTGVPEQGYLKSPLLDHYRDSSLARFHRHYYAEKPHGPDLWEGTYDQIQPALLPACVAVLLKKNAQQLCQWNALQHLTRSLLALGWHPRHIAGIIWSHWARDFPARYADPLLQADHLVRSGTGFLLRRIDRLSNFDCDSVRAAGICPPNPCCPVDLATLRQQLIDDAY
ncbi:hypothetical protein IV102_06125 [bacterium]|nr:hypothetical protein [bacterium]